MKNAMTLNPKDNVTTLLEKADEGEKIQLIDSDKQNLGTIVVKKDIPFAHKVALCDIPENGEVIKSGEVIGKATRLICAGEHAHVHNIVSIEGTRGKQA